MPTGDLNLLVVGDLHIEAWPKGITQDYAPWTAIFNQLHEYAEEHGVEHAVQLGDAFNGTNPTEESRLFFMQRLQRSELNWIFNRGNHEYEDITNNSFNYIVNLQKLFQILPNTQFIMAPTQRSIDGHSMLFLPWPHISTQGIKEKLLVFAHVPVPGSKADNGMELKNVQYTPKFHKNHYWIIGDLHLKQKGEQYIYPGAPLQLRYNDSPTRYFLHVTGQWPYKKKLIKFTPPYILETVQIIEKNAIDSNAILSSLQSRTENTYTKIKLASALYDANTVTTLEAFPRLFIEPIGKRDTVADSEKHLITTTNSDALRHELTVNHLSKIGFNKRKTKRALDMVNTLEKQT